MNAGGAGTVDVVEVVDVVDVVELVEEVAVVVDVVGVVAAVGLLPRGTAEPHAVSATRHVTSSLSYHLMRHVEPRGDVAARG